MQLTFRHCSIKLILTLLFGALTYIVAFCPCQRVGNCHINKLFALIAVGTGILMIENTVPSGIKPVGQ